MQRPRLTSPGWSPDGGRVLAASAGDDCEILSASIQRPPKVQSLYTCSEGERVDTVLQPDDETLIFTRRPARFGSPWRVHRYDLVTQESTQLTLPAEPGSGDIFLAFSADRQSLERGITERLILSPRDLNQPSVSSVGNRVAVVDQRFFRTL